MSCGRASIRNNNSWSKLSSLSSYLPTFWKSLSMRLLASAVYVMVIFLLLFIECSRAKSTCQDNDNDCRDLSVQHGLSHYTDNLLQGSKMIEIAYYAVIAADLNFTDLRIKTSRLALDMVRLQKKSTVVVTKTKTHLQNMHCKKFSLKITIDLCSN